MLLCFSFELSSSHIPFHPCNNQYDSGFLLHQNFHLYHEIDNNTSMRFHTFKQSILLSFQAQWLSKIGDSMRNQIKELQKLPPPNCTHVDGLASWANSMILCRI